MGFPRGLLLPAAALAATACGGASTPSSVSCTPPPTASAATPQAVAGPLTLTADRGLVPRGGVVRLTVTVAGPAHLVAPCASPMSLVVSDATGTHVFSDSPAPQPGDPCGDLNVAGGTSAVLHMRWAVDPTLPSGHYVLAVTPGDEPEISVPVDVGGGVAGAPAC